MERIDDSIFPSTARGLGINVVALLGAVVFAFPFYFMIVGSTVAPGEVFSWPIRLLPGDRLIQNYSYLLTETNFLSSLGSSLIYAVLNMIGVVILGTTAGYAFAKFSFPGHKPLFYLTLSTLAIPFTLLAIPLFNLLVQYNLVDTYPGVILPAMAHPVAVFFMKQNIEQTILDDMLNSARMDGASESQIFVRIVLPLLRPGMAALAVLLFVDRMNDLFWPLVVLRSPDKQVATVWLANVTGGTQAATPWDVLLPGAVITTIPVALVFIFMHKHFVQGLLSGSVKQ
ncbi:carbohydrate ABC transporter permease [Haloferax gibbonsii]|uniref:carbohydrate ABC transporter permease n=1 Tax=Haloferax gibbonsii TaxID=35746 RepID=UPI0018CD42F7|nr:carbohydrate ABC transporter permease [Haloferax gibbonsii]